MTKSFKKDFSGKHDFLQEITLEQELLDISNRQSKTNKEERKEPSLHEVLMEGYHKEQKQRELEDEAQWPNEHPPEHYKEKKSKVDMKKLVETQDCE